MTSPLTCEDRMAIRDVVSAYCWALDTGDVDAFAGCFANDAALVWDAFDQPMQWQGREALRHFASFLRNQPSTAGRQHHVTNLLLEPSETGARGKAYCSVALRQGHGPHLLNVMGWYEDEYRKEAGQWTISRRVIRDWSGPVLRNIAGQSGERASRPMPPPLAGLLYSPAKN